jgi:hypothetical protein
MPPHSSSLALTQSAGHLMNFGTVTSSGKLGAATDTRAEMAATHALMSAFPPTAV